MLFATDVDDVNVMIEGHLKEVPSPHLCGKTPRYAMQTLGTEWGRQIIGPEFWVNIARSSILYYADQAGVPVVVDDLRFPNELAMLKELGAVTVRVIRDDPKGVGEHPSEGALDDAPFDWEIYNNGTLESLYNAADSLVDLARS